MNEFFIIVLSLATGLGLGIFYFGGLWLTLKQLPYTKQPVLLTLVSFFGRNAACLFAFYLIIRVVNLEGVILTLAGFISMKIAFVRILSPGKKSKVSHGGIKW